MLTLTVSSPWWTHWDTEEPQSSYRPMFQPRQIRFRLFWDYCLVRLTAWCLLRNLPAVSSMESYLFRVLNSDILCTNSLFKLYQNISSPQDILIVFHVLYFISLFLFKHGPSQYYNVFIE